MVGLIILVLCGLYVGLALFVAKQVGKGSSSKFAKYTTIAVFVLIPTWDVIPGQLYHGHLCETEGGVKVFKTLEVDKTYFLPDGQPDEEKLGNRFDRPSVVDRTYSKVFHITKYQRSIVDKQTGNNLGTATDFWHYGGWFMKMILPDASSTVCPQYQKHAVSSSLWREVVHPRVDVQSGGQ